MGECFELVAGGRVPSGVECVQMARLSTYAVALLLAMQSATSALHHQAVASRYDVKRCTPKVVSKKSLPKPARIRPSKGAKPTGYLPVIAFEISDSGDVADARIKRSSGIANRDSYALAFVKGWKFNSRPGCGAIETETVVMIHFESDP